MILLLAFLIGVVSGLRSLTAPTVVAWAAHRRWLHLEGSPFSFMGSIASVAAFTLLALGELVIDKLPSTPSRTKPVGLVARIGLGGLCGASLASSGSASIVLGALLGAAGGIAGAFAGYQYRTRLVRAFRVPDLVVALSEDAVAIAGGLLIVSQL